VNSTRIPNQAHVAATFFAEAKIRGPQSTQSAVRRRPGRPACAWWCKPRHSGTRRNSVGLRRGRSSSRRWRVSQWDRPL